MSVKRKEIKDQKESKKSSNLPSKNTDFSKNPLQIGPDYAELFPHLNFYEGTNSAGFEFAPPSKLEIGGSYVLGTGIRNKNGSNASNTARSMNPSVDCLVFMPDSVFINKDHLNYRYADKRSAYLGVLEEHLKAKLIGNSIAKNKKSNDNSDKSESSLTVQSVKIEFLLGDIFRPVIAVNLVKNKNINSKDENSKKNNSKNSKPTSAYLADPRPVF